MEEGPQQLPVAWRRGEEGRTFTVAASVSAFFACVEPAELLTVLPHDRSRRLQPNADTAARAASHGLLRLLGYVSTLKSRWVDGRAVPVVTDASPGLVVDRGGERLCAAGKVSSASSSQHPSVPA